jgi:hypothetical protein
MASESDWINSRPRASLALNDHDWDQFMKRVLLEAYLELSDNFMTNIGVEEAMSLLRPSALNSGMAYAANSRRAFGITGNDIKAISEVLQIFQASAGVGPSTDLMHGQDYCTWVGPSDCPYLSGSPGSCRYGEMIMDEITRAINPSYCLRITCMKHEGGPECHYMIEKRGPVKPDADGRS